MRGSAEARSLTPRSHRAAHLGRYLHRRCRPRRACPWGLQQGRPAWARRPGQASCKAPGPGLLRPCARPSQLCSAARPASAAPTLQAADELLDAVPPQFYGHARRLVALYVPYLLLRPGGSAGGARVGRGWAGRAGGGSPGVLPGLRSRCSTPGAPPRTPAPWLPEKAALGQIAGRPRAQTCTRPRSIGILP